MVLLNMWQNIQSVMMIMITIMTRCWIVLQGVPMNSLRFLFEGQRIADNQTPKEVCFPPFPSFTTFSFTFGSIQIDFQMRQKTCELSGSGVSLKGQTLAYSHGKKIL